MFSSRIATLLLLSGAYVFHSAFSTPTSQIPIPIFESPLSAQNQNISVELFNDLEELSRIVDISYCVGSTGLGIQKPFLCASRCQDFPDFELVDVHGSTCVHPIALIAITRLGIPVLSFLIAAVTSFSRIHHRLHASSCHSEGLTLSPIPSLTCQLSHKNMFRTLAKAVKVTTRMMEKPTPKAYVEGVSIRRKRNVPIVLSMQGS